MCALYTETTLTAGTTTLGGPGYNFGFIVKGTLLANHA
jgi:hypothetical protein